MSSVSNMNSLSNSERRGPAPAGGPRCALVVLVLALLPAAALAQGKSQGVEVLALSPALQTAQPGAILSLTFRVTNHTPGPQQFLEKLTLPEDWTPVLPEGNFTLAAGAATVRLVVVHVPLTAPAARYPVTYETHAQRDPAVHDSGTVQVEVASVAKLALLVESQPHTAIAGRDYEIKLRVMDHGNTGLTVSLQATDDSGGSLVLTPREVTLPAEGNQVVTLTVHASAGDRRAHNQVVQVAASAPRGTQAPLATRAAAVVWVVPLTGAGADLKQRLPSLLTVSAVGGASGPELQAELSGGGALDEAGRREVAYDLCGPSTEKAGVYGNAAQYWANYSDPRLQVRLGDQSYGLSPLTTSYRYGRGLEVSVPPVGGGVSGGLYMVENEEGEAAPEVGLHLERQCGAGVDLRLNALTRGADADSSVEGPARIGSFLVTLHPREATISLEYGLCLAGSGEEEQRGQAYRVEAHGRVGRGVEYSLEKTQADPQYAGSYSGVDDTNAAVTFPLTRRLTGSIAYQDSREDPELLDVGNGVDAETLAEAGLSYALARGWQLSLQAADYHRSDSAQSDPCDYREQPLILTLNRSWRRANLRLVVPSGSRQDLLTGERQTVHDFNIFADWTPSPRCTLTLYSATGSEGDFANAYQLGQSANRGLTCTYATRAGASVGVNWGQNALSAGGYSTQWEVFARSARPGERGWCLRLRHSYQPFSDTPDDYTLSYSLPLGIPVGKRRRVGTIQGRIYDAQKPDQPGLADAILTAGGATVVTNARGEFSFPALAPGSYSLSVDSGAAGQGRVICDKLPLMVEVKGGEVTHVQIATVAAAQVRGSVLVMPAAGGDGGSDGPSVVGSGASAAGPSAREPVGLANVLVELNNGTEVHRTITDGGGRFLFEGIRPGEWTLKVYGGTLPPYHRLEQETLKLKLEPAQVAEATFHVLPIVRKIKMMDGGSLQAEAPGTPSAAKAG